MTSLRVILALFLLAHSPIAFGNLTAGAAAVDITPIHFPVLLNGLMFTRSTDKVKLRVHARSIALRDGQETIVLVVVDSCMLGRPLLDDIKREAYRQFGVREDRLMISATHTHTGPSVFGCLGTSADENYVPYLKQKVLEAIDLALQRLEPAEVGFGVGDAGKYTALRRWIRRPDRIDLDAFGNATVRANMHAARKLEDVVGESGPKDPDLSLLSIRALDGRPIAVLGAFSMHYFGDVSEVSADYFGLFAAGLERKIGRGNQASSRPFVAMLAHGCSGDTHRRDYRIPDTQWDANFTMQQYADELVDIAASALSNTKYSPGTLSMAERRLQLSYRTPDRQRLEWARRIVESMGPRDPKTREEVYAREQLFLHERSSTEVVIQAIRIGEIAIATTPTETYAITGLKIKEASPIPSTIVLDLANGADGYIPPPEQHLFGGYNTWAARSAALGADAEPQIVETALSLLETVSRKERRAWPSTGGLAEQQVLATRPSAWWRLDQFRGPIARDSSGHSRHAFFEAAVAYYLEGPHSRFFAAEGENRCVHFAGGRLRAPVGDLLQGPFSLSLWIWNGMPDNARPVAGWFASVGTDYSNSGMHLGLSGDGKVILKVGRDQVVTGANVIPRWTWSHIALVRRENSLRLLLNGRTEIEFPGFAGAALTDTELFVGGRSDSVDGWEGRIDEVILYDQAISDGMVRELIPNP